LAFEIFNFFTTHFALGNFLGRTNFMGLTWATILAVAFCAIDFSGLIFLYGPERIQGGRKEAWYLLGAWLLGATMSALMTWWAISLTLSNQGSDFIFVSRAEMLRYLPIFVALTVWMIRLLFIRLLSKAGNLFIQPVGIPVASETWRTLDRPKPKPLPAVAKTAQSKGNDLPLTTNEMPAFLLKTWAGNDREFDRIQPGTHKTIVA
jgi:hypothetical protein